MNKQKILIIEDEVEIRDALDYILSKNYDLNFAQDGIDGVKKALRNPPNLILLDLKMPEMDGFQTCRILREDSEFKTTPILVVSACNSSAERTRAFEHGADDFISKPFDPNELLARIQRKISDHSSQAPAKSSHVLHVDGSFYLNTREQQMIFGDQVVSISSIEFKLVHLLANKFGELVNRDFIIETVWEKQSVSPRLIDPHILAIRNKMKDFNYTIQSVYGKGYVLKKL